MDLNVYIGYDKREHLAAEVCKYSVERRSPVNVKFLKLEELPMFTREREPQQSTDFTYTRFLVPYLNQYKGWSIFCDCDFLFLTDVREILKYADESKAVMVCKHPQYIPRTQVKMDGVSQHRAWRKNWASLMLFNNEHPANQILTTRYVNEITPGLRMHQFHWLLDNQIGSLPLEWNCLDDYYHLENPKAVHYTDGGPWFDLYKNTHYAPLWEREYEHFTRATKII